MLLLRQYTLRCYDILLYLLRQVSLYFNNFVNDIKIGSLARF